VAIPHHRAQWVHAIPRMHDFLRQLEGLGELLVVVRPWFLDRWVFHGGCSRGRVSRASLPCIRDSKELQKCIQGNQKCMYVGILKKRITVEKRITIELPRWLNKQINL